LLGREGWLFSNGTACPTPYQQTLSSNVAKIAEVEKTLKAHNKRSCCRYETGCLRGAPHAPDSRSLPSTATSSPN
jgi:hypothetical protein